MPTNIRREEKNQLEQNSDTENFVYPLQQKKGRGRISSQCIKLHSINLIFLEKEQIFQKISSLKEFEYNATNFLFLWATDKLQDQIQKPDQDYNRNHNCDWIL